MNDRAYIPWVIIGAGRLGRALAHLGKDIGVDVKAVWNRSEFEHALPGQAAVFGDILELEPYLGGTIVWITVADEAIAAVAQDVAPFLSPADVVVHASGVLDSRVLREAGVRGPVGSIHPLLSIADPGEAVRRFSSCAWTVEGDFPAIAFGRWFLSHVGVEPHELDAEAKALYHASAVASSGLLVGLMDVAFELAAAAGFSSDEARAMLLPLAASTLTNLESRSTSRSLTGPVARGDAQTIARHRSAIAELGGDALDVYDALTARSKSLVED